MKRVEIMISRALDEEFLDLIEANDLNHFTAINPTTGKGFSNPKLGDEVWPQTNKMYIFYAGESSVKKLTQIISKLRKEFPTEGLGAFSSEAECIAGCDGGF